ncbi:MAG: hypothetical protein ACOYM5_02735 [Caulobacter sp.]
MSMDPEMARLMTVLDARIDKFEDKLNKAVRASYGASAKIEKAFNKANPGAAIRGQFDGFAKSTLAGTTALEALGGAGPVAVAAVGAVTVALKGMADALKFADDLDAMATKIGVTGEQLQELTFAAHENDVTTEALENSLQGLNVALGAYKSGVGDAKVKKAFEALGITRESVKDFNSAADLIPMLADRIRALGSTAEKVKVAKMMGIEDMVPMLERGSGAIAETTQRARDLGMVMSDDLKRKAADANRELEVMGEILKGKTNIALAETAVFAVDLSRKLGPLIAQLSEFNAQRTAGLNSGGAGGNLLRNPGAVVDMIKGGAAELAFARTRPAAHKPPGRRGGSGTPQGPGGPGGAVDGVMPETAGSSGGGRGGGSRSGGVARYSGPLPGYIKTAIAEGRFTEASIREQYPTGDFPIPMAVMDDLVLAGDAPPIEGAYDAAQYSQDQFSAGTRQGPPDVSVSGGRVMSPEDMQAVQDQFASAIEGGLWAAIQGGGKGVAEYFGDMFAQAMVRNAANGLSTLLMDFLNAAGSSGGAGIFSKAASVFAGMFATGGTIPTGQWGVVGEKGAEAVMSTPGGIRVAPNSTLRALSNGGPMTRGGMTVINYNTLQAPGGILAGELVDHFTRMNVAGAQAGATGGASLAASQVPTDMARRDRRSLAGR